METKHKEENGVIRITLTSDGTKGTEWPAKLWEKKCYLGEELERYLASDKFTPTIDVTYNIVIIRGTYFINVHNNRRIFDEGKRRELKPANMEVALLLRYHFTDKEIFEMGIWSIVAMLESTNLSDYEHHPDQMLATSDIKSGAENQSSKGSFLYEVPGWPHYEWRDATIAVNGYAFIESQGSPE